MSVTKLNLGMIKAEKMRIVKQQQIAAQEARLQGHITKTAQKILAEIPLKTDVYNKDSIPRVDVYVGNLKGLLSSTNSEFAPWNKLFVK